MCAKSDTFPQHDPQHSRLWPAGRWPPQSTGFPNKLTTGERGSWAGDAQGMAQRVVRLLEREGIRLFMAGEAKQMVKDRFDIHKEAPRLFGLVRRTPPACAVRRGASPCELSMLLAVGLGVGGTETHVLELVLGTDRSKLYLKKC